ncbi:MAG: hypothetical protein WAW39_16640 [Prosthecobacter sp.]|uniref:hypothetical protein n=1 Tax=Prosthecobacter sp. TaxID=1965333 RepID=UPI003BB0BC54
MKRILRKLLGIEPKVEIVPVLVERGEVMKLRTHAELAEMKGRWKRTLQGRAQDPGVRAIIEIIEYRISQASGLVQMRNNHAGNPQLVCYGAGEAAGLNDLLLELVRALHARDEEADGR